MTDDETGPDDAAAESQPGYDPAVEAGVQYYRRKPAPLVRAAQIPACTTPLSSP